MSAGTLHRSALVLCGGSLALKDVMVSSGRLLLALCVLSEQQKIDFAYIFTHRHRYKDTVDVSLDVSMTG